MVPGLLSCFRKGRSGTSKTAAHNHNHNADVVSSDISPSGGGGGDGVVVVELFSSQGCKTSPEAELLMSRIGRGDFNLDQKVIVLVFHVDYWDYMGWKDPFGSSQWTVRQKTYVESLNLDTMFTPQVVVMGRVQCVGDDDQCVLSNIRSAPRFPSPSFQVTFQRPTLDTLQVSLTGTLRMKIDNQGANVMVALYENGLVIDCPKGENKDRVLSNDYVVRRLDKLCSVKDYTAKKNISGTINFPLWDGFNTSKCGLVLFVQNNTHHIFGAQKFNLPDNLNE